MQNGERDNVELCDVSGFRVGVVAARFNRQIADKLLANAREELTHLGIVEKNIRVVRVAGSVEIPLALQLLAETNQYDALVALGVVIRGETPHFDYVCKITSEGVLRVTLDHKIPVGFGVLTLTDEAQAWERVKSASHAVRAALELACLKKNKE